MATPKLGSRAWKREDLDGRYFRSSWEANYARYLNFLIKHRHILKWEYESEEFWFEDIKRGTRSYKPDFKVWRMDGTVYYVEIKGWMDVVSATKLKRMAKYYPNIKVELVDAKAYKAIARSVWGLIPNWE